MTPHSSAQQGNVLILTISILFLVATQILTMGLLSSPTLALEGSTASVSQEVREETAAALANARIDFIRWYEGRSNYNQVRSYAHLHNNRNQFEFANRRSYIMNTNFNGAMSSPFQTSVQLIGTGITEPLILRATSTGKGMRYVMSAPLKLRLPSAAGPLNNIIPTCGDACYIRDTIGVIQALLTRGYAYQTIADKNTSAINEATLSRVNSNTNNNLGIHSIWGPSTAKFLFFNVGGIGSTQSGQSFPLGGVTAGTSIFSENLNSCLGCPNNGWGAPISRGILRVNATFPTNTAAGYYILYATNSNPLSTHTAYETPTYSDPNFSTLFQPVTPLSDTYMQISSCNQHLTNSLTPNLNTDTFLQAFSPKGTSF